MRMDSVHIIINRHLTVLVFLRTEASHEAEIHREDCRGMHRVL